MPSTPPVQGLIGWFATNHVAANLLMAFIVLGGIYSIIVVKKESFPRIYAALVVIHSSAVRRFGWSTTRAAYIRGSSTLTYWPMSTTLSRTRPL